MNGARSPEQNQRMWAANIKIHKLRSDLNAALLAVGASEKGPERALKALEEMKQAVVEYISEKLGTRI